MLQVSSSALVRFIDCLGLSIYRFSNLWVGEMIMSLPF